MIKQKSVLTENQKEEFKKLIDKANDIILENRDNLITKEKFVIAGQLRIPDNKNNIKEPEIEFALLTGEEANILTDTFIDMRERQEGKDD